MSEVSGICCEGRRSRDCDSLCTHTHTHTHTHTLTHTHMHTKMCAADGLQMMFQLHGPRDSAMCSVEAKAHGASHKIRSLALDFTDGKRYVLAGKPEDVVFKGLTKLR